MKASRLAALDGLRAFAVGLVLVEHTLMTGGWARNFDIFRPGAAGVRLFFVLSGWLITGILLDAQAATTDRWHVWRAFYARRALRILPVAYLAIGVACLLALPGLRTDWPWYVSYLANLRIAAFPAHNGLVHFWSLAIEEQFYLIWPFIILWVPRRWLSQTIVAVIVIAALSRFVIDLRLGPIEASVWTIARLDALAVGGWISVRQRDDRAISLWLMALCGLVCVGLGSLGSFAWHALWTESGLILVSAVMVLLAVSWAPLASLLAWRPLVQIGIISYGIYVWHFVILNVVPVAGRRVFVITGLTLVVSALSWILLEKPFNDQKRRFPYVPVPPKEAPRTEQFTVIAPSLAD